MWREATVELPLSQDASLARGAGVANLHNGQKHMSSIHFTTHLPLVIYEGSQLVLPQLVPPPGQGS